MTLIKSSDDPRSHCSYKDKVLCCTHTRIHSTSPSPVSMYGMTAKVSPLALSRETNPAHERRRITLAAISAVAERRRALGRGQKGRMISQGYETPTVHPKTATTNRGYQSRATMANPKPHAFSGCHHHRSSAPSKSVRSTHVARAPPPVQRPLQISKEHPCGSGHASSRGASGRSQQCGPQSGSCWRES